MEGVPVAASAVSRDASAVVFAIALRWIVVVVVVVAAAWTQLVVATILAVAIAVERIALAAFGMIASVALGKLATVAIGCFLSEMQHRNR